MSSTTYTLTLARSENGNWSLQPSGNLAAHPLPPMAFPASMSPSEAQDYAAGFLPLAGVPAPESLAWHPHGFTRTREGSRPAYRTSWTVSVQSLSL
jgi:hypothetical protein